MITDPEEVKQSRDKLNKGLSYFEDRIHTDDQGASPPDIFLAIVGIRLIMTTNDLFKLLE